MSGRAGKRRRTHRSRSPTTTWLGGWTCSRSPRLRSSRVARSTHHRAAMPTGAPGQPNAGRLSPPDWATSIKAELHPRSPARCQRRSAGGTARLPGRGSEEDVTSLLAIGKGGHVSGWRPSFLREHVSPAAVVHGGRVSGVEVKAPAGARQAGTHEAGRTRVRRKISVGSREPTEILRALPVGGGGPLPRTGPTPIPMCRAGQHVPNVSSGPCPSPPKRALSGRLVIER